MTERELRARAREIRANLPGQLRRERLATAALLYCPLCSLDDLHRRLARTLPWRPGYVRRVSVVPIERADDYLQRLIGLGQGFNELVPPEVPRQVVVPASVVTKDNVDKYEQYAFT